MSQSVNLPIEIAGQTVPVATSADLPPTSQVPIGSCRTTLDDGHLWQNTTSGWVDITAGGGGGGITSVANVGGFVGLFRNLTGAGTIANFKTIQSSDGLLTITANANDVDITAGTIPSPTGDPNRFAFFDNSGVLNFYGNWELIQPYLGSNVNLSIQPDDLSAYTVSHSWSTNVDPLQDSPNDSMALHSFNVNLDSGATGFAFGTAGQAATLITGGYVYNGDGASFGILRGINFYNAIGNGTDPGTFDGFSSSSHAYTFAAGVTLDGSITGYDLNVNINASATTTSNFQILWMSDFSQMPVNVYGYQGLVCQPTIATIKNNSNFTVIGAGGTITLMEGNAGYAAMGVFPTITTLGTGGFNALNSGPTIGTMVSNSSVNGNYIGGTITTMGATGCGVVGYNFNTHVVTSHGSVQGYICDPRVDGGDASVTCYASNMNQVTTTGSVNVMNLNGLTAGGADSDMYAGSVSMNFNGKLVPLSAQTLQTKHILFTDFNMTGTGAVTGTDIFCAVLSPGVNFGTITDSIAVGPTGLGVSMVGFAGQTGGHGQIDILNAVTPTAIFQDDFTLGEWRNVNTTVINSGYTGACTSATAFYHAIEGAGLFATDHWGLKVVTEGIHNYVPLLAIGTLTKKVTPGTRQEIYQDVDIPALSEYYATKYEQILHVDANTTVTMGAVTSKVDLLFDTGVTVGGGVIGYQSVINRNDAADLGAAAILAGNYSVFSQTNGSKSTSMYVGCLTGSHSVSDGTVAVMADFYALASSLAAATVTQRLGIYIEPDSGYVKESWIPDKVVLGGATYAAPANDVAVEAKGPVQFPSYTTVAKNALTVAAGTQVYDSTLNQMSYFNGTIWIDF